MRTWLGAAIVVLGAGAAALVALAAEPAGRDGQDLLGQGVSAYEAGRYAEAERDFRDLLARAPANPTVLFNLGDAAFRQGKWALAVFSYEWVLTLDPADAEATENLDLARGKLVADQVPSNVSESMVRVLDFLARVPPMLTGLAFLALWTVGWLLLTLRIWRGTPTTAAALALLLGSLAFGAHVAYEQVVLRGPPRAVLQAAEVDVKSGPSPSYTTLFALHAGTVVRRFEERGGWSRVAVPHGPGGWIPSDTLAVIGRPETLPPLG